MSTLLTNNFQLPEDNWYQISSLGEFKHNPTGLLQIIDEDSCRSMVERFSKESSEPNFPGILIDFDHFSLDTDKPSEAAGWICELQQRPSGLWAKIRWSDKGEESVRGGRYRFISPVFRQDECLSMGENRIKPLHLVNAAVTNDPNINGMVPLSNKRAEEPAAEEPSASVEPPPVHRISRPLLDPRLGAMLNRALALAQGVLVNRSPQDEDQRKAMFASMGGGGGGGGGGSGFEPVYRDYSPTRASKARIQAIGDHKARLEAQAPTAPELKTFDQIDTRQLKNDLIQQGMPFDQVYQQVEAAEDRNRQVQKELSDIKKKIRRKYTDPKKQKVALQAYLDKVAVGNDKLMAEYNAASSEHQLKLADLDRDMEEERIRGKELEARSSQKEYNQEVEDQIARDKAALRKETREAEALAKQMAQEERRKAAERRALEKKQDPVQINYQTKKTNRAYWESLSRGDLSLAEKLAPGANHQQNSDDLAKMLPGGKRSPRNEKTYQSVLKYLESESPNL